jgi:NAD(P)-dependent dehydrogenase (short-subunit alcohol dehydrogenase family)
VGQYKVIILTGASGGVGQKIVGMLAEIDAVTAIYNSNKPRASIENVQVVQVDLSNENDILQFATALKAKKYRKIVVIHMATLSKDNLALNVSSEDWDKVFAINVKANFLFAKYLTPLMMAQSWGRIIHISSYVADNGVPGTLTYSASKSALRGLSNVLSKEYSRFGITSNILQLGYFEDGLINSISREKAAEIKKKVPSKKFGNVVNIFNAIKFIIDSDYVTGSTICIDGGI